MSTPDRDPPNDDELLDIALNVSDGAPTDWETTRPRDPRLSKKFDKLRTIEAVAQRHRTRPGSAANATAADAIEPQSMPPLFTWGNLRVLEKLGEGGFGEVWRAWDPALEREVAVKLRRADGRERGALRWLDEARRLARVRHPHVLLVHGADVHDGRAGIWTDLVRGQTLTHWLDQFGTLGAREAALVGIDLCAALSAVHAVGIVHGDVKASNVMREGDAGRGSTAGRIVLMDFGAAHETTGSGSPSAGTPLYSAPEVLAGGALTPSADLYALGVLLYRLVSGQFPLEGGTVDEMLTRHASGERRSLRALRPDLPPAFVQIVERATEPDPRHRFGDAADMERALVEVLGARLEAHSTRRFDSKMLAAVFALGVACCAATWWITLQWPRWSKPHFRIAPTGASIATSLAAVVPGTEPYAYFGHAVTPVGDVNGDSLTDILVTSVNEDAGRGSIDLYLGRRGAAPERTLHIRGEKLGDAFGYAIAGGGDLNGDGWSDFAVGARVADTKVLDAGRVYLFFGGPSLDSIPDFVLANDQLVQYFGNSVACGGDVNGDGYDDLAVGAPLDASAGTTTGRAFVYFGGPNMDVVPDLDLTSAIATSQYGVDVELGDLNGDGFAEVIVGSNWDNTDAPLAGRVFIFHGGRTPDATPDLTVRGPYQQALFGYPLCVLDLNGDQYGDLVIGEGGAEHGKSSQVRIFFGGSRFDAQVDLTLFGPTSSDAFGYAIESAGDVNGDGLVDLLVTAPHQDEVMRNSGAAYVYFGGRNMDATADLKVLGDEEWARFGWAAASLGDSRGDGFADFVVGAPIGMGVTRNSGKLYFFDVQRYAFVRPRPGDVWRSGKETTIAWHGGEPADIALSTDGGRSFVPVAGRVGGQGENALAFTPPQTPSDSVWVRLTTTRQDIRGKTSMGPIRITP